ncbi:MAG: DUF1566 domain-containing protein [Pseudomonadales bacterium]|nr:DUF1566 domain-containing protein [Pseudomonadales bacterium]
MNWVARGLVIAGTLILAVIFGRYEHSPTPAYEGRYIKLSRVGELMRSWQGPWSCVLDTQTNLVWENKTDDESIHDALWTFSWYQDDKGVKNSGDCYFEPDRCDTSDLIMRMNQEKTCGISNWRLPTSKELSSLIFNIPRTGEAKIANDFFSHTKRGDYWSSDADIPLQGVYAHLKTGAIAIDFIEGKPRAIPYRNAAFVRLVSSNISIHTTDLKKQ